MKNLKIQLIVVLLGLSILVSCKKEANNFEIKTVDFENSSIDGTGYWNGSNGSGSFNSSGITFSNNYSTSFSSWDGFSYSQKADIVGGTDNQYYKFQYCVFDGANGTNKFAVFYPPYQGASFASFPGGAEKLIRSVNVCNSTYAALSMKKGDDFAKKFGGASGNDKDWFKMTIIGYNAAGDSVNSIGFYLADYRFNNNSSDYMVKKWTTVDLSSLGKINKFTFRFSSSDSAAWGPNTPTIVCIDNIKYEEPLTVN